MTEQVGKIIFPDTYGHRLACGNCSFSVGLKIPLGITVTKYIEGHICPNCGCKLLSQDSPPYNYPTGLPMIYLPHGIRRE